VVQPARRACGSAEAAVEDERLCGVAWLCCHREEGTSDRLLSIRNNVAGFSHLSHNDNLWPELPPARSVLLCGASHGPSTTAAHFWKLSCASSCRGLTLTPAEIGPRLTIVLAPQLKSEWKNTFGGSSEPEPLPAEYDPRNDESYDKVRRSAAARLS